MLIKLHFRLTFESENIQKKKKNTGILMDQQRKCRGSDPHHSLMWLRQHVWLKHTHPPLELSMQHVTSHQSPHIYCMRRYWCQVSSSYVPDGVSPPCSILLPLFAHTWLSSCCHRLGAVSSKYNFYSFVSISTFVASGRYEVPLHIVPHRSVHLWGWLETKICALSAT